MIRPSLDFPCAYAAGGFLWVVRQVKSAIHQHHLLISKRILKKTQQNTRTQQIKTRVMTGKGAAHNGSVFHTLQFVRHCPCTVQGLYRSSSWTEVQPPADLWFVADCKLSRFCHAESIKTACMWNFFSLMRPEFTLQPFPQFRQSCPFVSSVPDAHTPKTDT